MMKRFTRTAILTAALLTPAFAHADVVLDWNAITVATPIAQGQNAFAPARLTEIALLAVFEAVGRVSVRQGLESSM